MRSQHNTHHRIVADGFHGNVSSDRRTYLMRALSHSDHLSAVVRSIFVLTRSAEGGIALELSDVPVRELVTEVHALVEPFAVADGVTLLIDCEHAPAVVRGERTALLWALMNLACRVVKSTPRGGLVMLSAVVLLNTVELRVTHTGSDSSGTSISPRFERAGRAVTTDEVEIARDLTRLMGGELLVQDTIGEGALYAMRFHAAWCPAQRVARISMAKAA